MLKMIDSNSDCRFVTLTLKHYDAPLAVQLDRLVSSFRLLRNHPQIAPSLVGGAWFIEVKLSKDRARWHPHLHVIVEGAFIDARTLSRSWYQVTGDSYITDIRSITDRRQRAQYVTKYATKPLHNEVTLDPVKLEEFIPAIKGRRLYQCFGTWSRAVKTQPSPTKKLTPLGRVDSIWRDALDGDISALVLMHQSHARWPALRKAFPLPSNLSPIPPPPCGAGA